MKKLVAIALFIFWSAVTAILIAGLVFYQKNNTPIGQPPVAKNLTPTATINQVTELGE